MVHKKNTETAQPLLVDTLITADHLFTGEHNPEQSPNPTHPKDGLFSPGAIAFKAGEVVAVGTPDTVKANVHCDPHNMISLPGHILMPGLINAHAHSAMTLLRGLADDLPLMTWLQEYIWPAESQWVSESFVAAGTKLAMAEMLLSGTTSFADMYFFPEVVAKAVTQAGMRAFLACPILDFPTPWGSGPKEYLEKTQALIGHYRSSNNSSNPLVRIGFGPHAPYTVSDEPLLQIAELAQANQSFVQMHVHETQHEVEEAVAKTGLRPLARLHKLGLLNEAFQAVHVTCADESDIEIAKHCNISLIHCPSSNLKLASGISPIGQFLENRINVAIGTDGAASNNGLDMFSELKLACLLAKVKKEDASACPAGQALQMATKHAGQALAPNTGLGQLRVGAPADCIAIQTTGQVSAYPMYHPLSHLAYSMNAQQVQHVWVQGQNLVKDRKLLSLNLDEILHEAHVWQQKIREQSKS